MIRATLAFVLLGGCILILQPSRREGAGPRRLYSTLPLLPGPAAPARVQAPLPSGVLRPELAELQLPKLERDDAWAGQRAASKLGTALAVSSWSIAGLTFLVALRSAIAWARHRGSLPEVPGSGTL